MLPGLLLRAPAPMLEASLLERTHQAECTGSACGQSCRYCHATGPSTTQTVRHELQGLPRHVSLPPYPTPRTSAPLPWWHPAS